MKERPILFSAPMVRAILAGTKTQTRRVAKGVVAVHSRTGEALATLDSAGPRVACPYGQPGDRLWVRESLSYDAERGHYYAATTPGSLGNASGREWLHNRFEDGYNDVLLPARSVPSIHMPRWASRITLEVTAVRVERLQDISDADAMAEGAEPRQPATASGVYIPGQYRLGFRDLWESINDPGSWDANPWVWVVEFPQVEGRA